jgi:hypothetical protein
LPAGARIRRLAGEWSTTHENRRARYYRLTAARTREIGIRLTLGATPMSVLQFVVGQSIRMTIAGVVVPVIHCHAHLDQSVRGERAAARMNPPAKTPMP